MYTLWVGEKKKGREEGVLAGVEERGEDSVWRMGVSEENSFFGSQGAMVNFSRRHLVSRYFSCCRSHCFSDSPDSLSLTHSLSEYPILFVPVGN